MIEILLPVYNGGKYLNAQIDSIIRQSNNNWILKIRNDGSSDNSQSIIEKYCRKYPEKIFLIDSPKENLGLIRSLNCLMAAPPHGKYIMFSDQDDVWLHDKIEVSLEEITKLEGLDGDLPVMICTDAKCVDADLNIINESFFVSQKFQDGIIGNINKMIALNVVQGCTIMMNRKALEVSYPLPDKLSVHDMWIGINCAYYGKVKYIYRPTLLYRQHQSNVLGSLNIGLKYYLSRMKQVKSTLSSIIWLKNSLSFNIRLDKVLYYKLKYMFCRL